MKERLNILCCLLLVSFVFSCKQVKMSEADLRFAQGEYFEAAAMYRKIYSKAGAKKRELRGEASYKMAECYRIINNIARARSAYANAVRYLPDDSLIALQYARILHKNGLYAQSAEQYRLFLNYFPDNAFAQNGLEGTKLALEMKAHPTRYTVKRMDLFNSRRSEFSPSLLPPEYDAIYFSSARDEAQGEKNSTITGLKNNDIFYSKKDENGKWLKPEPVEGINTEADEGSVSFSATGSTMYYTYCPQDPSKPTSANIYVSQRSGGAWGKGTLLELSKDTVSVFGHPSPAPSGDFLYFVSDMPGGFGGKDIWRAALLGDEVNYIENLGASINTAGDEMFPV
ncbi:MAG: hypothetical protein LBR34_09120, partial [Prevotella sp.]|nr:hypothetical protein [Prevotella sp.]